METDPPPLPDPSKKRILPAFLLGLIFCSHRLYAGKYFTGLVQILWIAGSLIWFETVTSDLMSLIHAGNFDFSTIERVSDWQQTHPAPILPMLSMILIGIWCMTAVSACRSVVC